MNATPPVLPAFVPDAGAAAASTTIQFLPAKSGGRPNFAGTLKDVGIKAGRKPVTMKAGTGESVPPAGNSAPPPRTAAGTGSPASTPAPSNKSPDEQALVAAAASATPPTAPPVPAAGFPTAPRAGNPVSSLPLGVSVASATSNDTGPAEPPEPPAVNVAVAPAVAGNAPAAPPPPPRPSFKAALQHPDTALNASDDSDGANDVSAAAAVTTTITTAAAAVAAAAAADATSNAQPSTDGSEAATLAAVVSSRNAYSTTANATDDPAGELVSATSVAGASSTDASLAVSAAAETASAAQAMLLQGATRADKHMSGTIDATTPSGSVDAAGITQLGSASVTVSVDPAPVPTLRVAANVDSAEFPQDLSSRVSWMVDNNINGAKLQVNPPQLGPIELRIFVNGDHAQVWMSAHSALTRDALESSTPKLREMLGTQGFNQVSVDISQGSFQDRSAYSHPYETRAARRSAVGAAATVASISTMPSSLGAVDAYA